MSNVFVIACGSNRSKEWEVMWPEWKANGHITIDCWAKEDFNIELDNNRIEDYIRKRKEDVRNAGRTPADDSPKHQARSIVCFIRTIQRNDIVIVRTGRKQVLGIGIIKDNGATVSPKGFLPTFDNHLVRKIRWLAVLNKPEAIDSFFATITVVDWHLTVTLPRPEHTEMAMLSEAEYYGNKAEILSAVISKLA